MTAELGYRICASVNERIAALHALLRLLPEGDTVCAWLERPTDYHGFALRDAVAQTEAVELPTTWTQGRIFHPAVDVRWEQRPDGGTHIVALADHLPAPFRQSAPLQLVPMARPDGRIEPAPLILWGTRRGGVWQEGRIPNLQRCYPDWPGPYAAILAQTYESRWEYADDMAPAVRVVTRYMSYLVDYDPRPTQDVE